MPQPCRGLFCDNDRTDCTFISNASSELSELCLVESVRLNTISPVPVMKLNATFAGNINCSALHKIRLAKSFQSFVHFVQFFHYHYLSLS